MTTDINSLNMSTQLEHMHHLLTNRKITIKLGFWGSRNVTIEGCEGSISLEKLANKVIKAGYYSNVDLLTSAERIAGQEIVSIIDYSLYGDANKFLATLNPLTKFLGRMRDSSWTRWQINEYTRENFQSYNESAFRIAFELKPEDRIEDHPAYSRKEGARIFTRHVAQNDQKLITPNMVQSIQWKDGCMTSCPCQHECTIILKNGRERRTVIEGFEGYILFKATRDSINWNKDVVRHFKGYSDFQLSDNQGVALPLPTAEVILSRCFQEQADFTSTAEVILSINFQKQADLTSNDFLAPGSLSPSPIVDPENPTTFSLPYFIPDEKPKENVI